MSVLGEGTFEDQALEGKPTVTMKIARKTEVAREILEKQNASVQIQKKPPAAQKVFKKKKQMKLDPFWGRGPCKGPMVDRVAVAS